MLVYPVGILLMLRLVWKGPIKAAHDDAQIEAGRPEAPVIAGGMVAAKGKLP